MHVLFALQGEGTRSFSSAAKSNQHLDKLTKEPFAAANLASYENFVSQTAKVTLAGVPSWLNRPRNVSKLRHTPQHFFSVSRDLLCRP